jgi:superfamily II DNA or RNA helicase
VPEIEQAGLGDELFGTRLEEARKTKSGGDLFIVDNSDEEWKVRDYLSEWADIATAFDIATGYFEIGALLALGGQWQKLDKLRILMGDEVSMRTQRALLAGVQRVERILDESVEREKLRNDFLTGVPAIVDAMQRRQIECRVYTKDKFHAKAYITHAKQAVVGSSALVGSSNFTFPGLTSNVELNVQLRREVELLQEWYERHWEQAEDVTPGILRVIERHTHEYTPFDVYSLALHELFARHQVTASEWEQNSALFGTLDQYQREGYRSLVDIANVYRGALLCDGVGLGKTFVGMMVIQRLIEHEGKRVALFVPKAVRAVWDRELKRHIPQVAGRDFSSLAVFNHTDLSRGGEYKERIDRVAEVADVIVIDEAHHFRNPGIKGTGEKKPSRYRRMFEIAAGKTLFLLTATPVNNRLIDLQHMIELFSRQEAAYFNGAPLGIHSLAGHFRVMENNLKSRTEQTATVTDAADGIDTNEAEAEQVLINDSLFRALVVQRSRAYVRKSQEQQGSTAAIFPDRAPPQVADYSIAKSYGPLLQMVEKAFDKAKPLFSLAIYYPLAYYQGPDKNIDALTEGRQKQVVGLIRIQFLKRFESSVRAFELSCNTLMRKLLVFVKKHSATDTEGRRFAKWTERHEELIAHVQQRFRELAGDATEDDEDEDILSEGMLEDVEELSRGEYKVEDIVNECYDDLETLTDFLNEIRRFDPSHDDKLRALIKILRNDPVASRHKVLVFSEYMATARYLKAELEREGIEGVDEIDSANADRLAVIERFAPYYNGSSSGDLAKAGRPETRVLISTDVLSEGLNLQDATRMINYDLHWNPVRLMQRIGRVDRRMDPAIESHLVADHPEQRELRGKVAFWNFLPPNELDRLLKLYSTVSHKALRISKAFGIEGRKLLKPEDDYDALRDFNSAYEGTTTPVERLHLEYQKLLQDNPELEAHVIGLPGRVFSGKSHPTEGARAIFFCYTLPGTTPGVDSGPPEWSLEAGETHWYLFDLSDDSIIDDSAAIAELIRCGPETPRHTKLPQPQLVEVRKKVEKHITNSYLKAMDAPLGEVPVLRAWMELS